MDLKVLYDKDCDLDVIRDKKVAVIGYGSQGHAHALNLHDSGVDVIVGLRPSSASWDKAKSDGLDVTNIWEAVEDADVVMMLVPDELAAGIYDEHVEPYLKSGMTLAFAHGLSIHFGRIKPPEGVDVIMIAPKSPGQKVRDTFVAGSGVPMLVAVDADESGTARDMALSYASAIGGGRAGIIETTFKDETETDLFGEQTVLCGGFIGLIKMAFLTLVNAGYPPAIAYFECLHETKLIADLVVEGGIANMFARISNTAEYGAHTRGPRIIGDEAQAAMSAILTQIQSGEFADEWFAENEANGSQFLEGKRDEVAQLLIEQVGAELRPLFTNVAG